MARRVAVVVIGLSSVPPNPPWLRVAKLPCRQARVCCLLGSFCQHRLRSNASRHFLLAACWGGGAPCELPPVAKQQRTKTKQNQIKYLHRFEMSPSPSPAQWKSPKACPRQPHLHHLSRRTTLLPGRMFAPQLLPVLFSFTVPLVF